MAQTVRPDKRQTCRWSTLLHRVLGVVVATVVLGVAGPARAQFDPATLATAASEAQAIAGKAKDFLQFIGYLPGDPDPQAKLSAKLNEIQTSLDHLQATANQTLDTVKRLEQGQVRDDNDNAINEYITAVELVSDARTELAAFLANPHDPSRSVHMANAEEKSRDAVIDFESRPGMFTIYGELANESRFSHLLMYGGYVQALMVRVAVIQAVEGARGFTQAPYTSELLASAATLRNLIQETNTGIEVRTSLYGSRNPLQCLGATLTLVDHILYYPEDVEAHTTESTVPFPFDTCDSYKINLYLEDPINQARAARAATYGVNELSDLADMLTSYADYGQPSQPAYQFGNWILGSEYNTANTLTFVPNGAAVPGATVGLVVPAQHEAYQLPLGAGPIAHMASGLCLTGAAPSTFTLEVCYGLQIPPVGPLHGDHVGALVKDDQTWTRLPNGTIVHTKTGLCLSGQITTPVSVGSVSPTGSHPGISATVSAGTGTPQALSLPGLNLAACDAGRTDQVWSTIDPTNPPPRIR